MIRALAVLISISSAAWCQSIEEPKTYRTDNYRAPVPDEITGGVTVGTQDVFALWSAEQAGFVDVLPQPPKPANLPKGTIWREKPRDSIPGAIWLPNVGYGQIADVTADYFKSGLEQASGGDRSYPVVIFCLEDCWMSWNAAKRAIEWGYTAIYWYPEGTDGWAFQDHPFERVIPMPGQPKAGG